MLAGVFQSRTKISATPGQKKKAYAHAFPQNATKLAGACLIDIRSTTKAIWDKRFWMNIFRILWWIDSRRKSEPDEPDEPDDPSELSDRGVEACCSDFGRLSLRWDVGKATLHSGRVMMPTTASKYTGRSVPEMDWLFFPLSISSKPVHHLLRMFTRRSKSSGLKLLQE